MTITKRVALRVFNVVYQTHFIEFEETVRFAKRSEMRPFAEHIDKCRECGPGGLCDIGSALLKSGKDSIA